MKILILLHVVLLMALGCGGPPLVKKTECEQYQKKCECDCNSPDTDEGEDDDGTYAIK